MATVFILSDIGASSPCNGVIYGVFDTREEALAAKARVDRVGSEWCGSWQDDQCVMHSFVMNTWEPYVLNQLSRKEAEIDSVPQLSPASQKVKDLEERLELLEQRFCFNPAQ